MIRPATINAGNRPDARRPAVMPLGERHVPEWWVDETPDRAKHVATARELAKESGRAGYDWPQTSLDAETGMRAANAVLRPYLRRAFR